MARLIVAPTTELADFAACPRRYHLRHEIGLSEYDHDRDQDRENDHDDHHDRDQDRENDHDGDPSRQAKTPRPAEPQRAPLDITLDAAERGTLAHHLLETVDLSAYHPASPRGRALLRELTATAGHDPDAADVARVIRQVGAFLDSPFGRKLASLPSSSVQREVPFAFAVGHEGRTRLLIKGQMDLVVTCRDDANPDEDTLLLLDYKLVRALSDSAHRHQLLVYAAAARALWNPTRLRVGLVPLADAVPAPRFIELDDAQLASAPERLGALGGALARARQRQIFEGRPLDTCRDLGCGYRLRCHGTF